MKLLNLGCGDTRPGEPWINVDNFATQFAEAAPELVRAQGEPNYVEADISKRLPFDDGSVDGVLLSHVLEHFDAQEGLRLLIECYRVLQPGGIVLVSVPDASYFRKVYPEDRNENWKRLFDTTDPKNTYPTFFEAALWFEQHKAILTEDAVWGYLTRSGFGQIAECRLPNADWVRLDVFRAMESLLNRRIFSVEMAGVK